MKLDNKVYLIWSGCMRSSLGIQMIPFTPISEQLIAPSWISDAWPAKMSPLATQLSADTGDGWLGFLYMAHAQIDPADAWTESNTMTGYDDGNSKTNTLWWAASRP